MSSSGHAPSSSSRAKRGVLFVNKSASSTHLSRSQGKEDVSIRRFIQRGNRNSQAEHVPDSGQTPPPSLSPSAQPPVLRPKYQRIAQSGNLQEPLEADDASRVEGFSKRRGRLARRWKVYVAPEKGVTNDSQLSTPSAVPTPLSTRVAWSANEKRGIDYFVQMMSPAFTPTETSTFWNVHLQIALSRESAVRLLVTALASLHEALWLSPMAPARSKDCRVVALRTCNRAIRRITDPDERLRQADLEMTCILMVSFENLRGDFGAARRCLESCVAMSKTSKKDLIQYRWSNPVGSTDTVTEQQSIEITKAKMVSSFHVAGWPGGLNLLAPVAFLPQVSPKAFANFEDVDTAAEIVLSMAVRFAQSLMGRAGLDAGSPTARLVLAQCERFEQHLAAFRELASRTMSDADVLAATEVPEMKVREALIVFSCIALDSRETAFDAWTSTFQAMLAAIGRALARSTTRPAELLYDPFSPTFLPPLWLIASRCREPAVRKQAIALMFKFRRRETSHDSFVASRLAEVVRKIEERGLEKVESCTNVPAANRIQLISAEFCSARGQTRLKYAKGDAPRDKPIVTAEWVDWCTRKPPLRAEEAVLLNQLLQLGNKYCRWTIG